MSGIVLRTSSSTPFPLHQAVPSPTSPPRVRQPRSLPRLEGPEPRLGYGVVERDGSTRQHTLQAARAGGWGREGGCKTIPTSLLQGGRWARKRVPGMILAGMHFARHPEIVKYPWRQAAMNQSSEWTLAEGRTDDPGTQMSESRLAISMPLVRHPGRSECPSPSGSPRCATLVAHHRHTNLGEHQGGSHGRSGGGSSSTSQPSANRS